MAEILRDIVNKFQGSWQTGKYARLNLECHAGQVWINLQLHIGHHPPPQHHHHQPRRPGPSRIRRQVRRAEARAAAKAASEDNNATAEVAVQTENNFKPIEKTYNAVEQTVLPAKTCTLTGLHGLAAGPLHPPPQDIPAALAGHVRQLAEQAQPWHQTSQHVTDTFCTDQDYEPAANVGPPLPQYGHHVRHGHGHSLGIPQLDGSMDTLPSQWSCKCCHYETFFNTEDELQHHHARHMMEYEECNICFTGHVWIPRA